MVSTYKMENPLEKLKKSGLNSRLWGLIIQNPSISITDITNKVDRPLPNVSRALSQLRELKLVKVKLEEGKGGTIKMLFPSMKGYLEYMTKEGAFTDKELDTIDNFYFHPKNIKLLYRSTSEKELADPTLMFMKTAIINTKLLNKEVRKDKTYKEAFDNFMKVVIKHKKAFMNL